MTYATRDDLEQLFTEVEINNLESAGRDVELVLVQADEEINSYLAVRYLVPIDPVPTHLTAIACDIARYRLYTDAAEGEPQKRYDAAISWLKRAASGDVMIPGAQLVAVEGSTVRGQAPPRSGQARSRIDWSAYGD